MERKTAFAIGAHPDDIEFHMSGTLILLKEAGYEIHYMNIANGSCGGVEHDAEDLAQIRRKEAQDAAGFIGAIFHGSLTSDIEIFYEKRLLAALGSIIRDVAPEIILTHSPTDYMEDHMNTSRLAVTSAFCRSMPNFPVSPKRDPVDNEVTIYHAQPHGNRDGLGALVVPDIFVDISSVMDQKKTMLARHRSQKEWLDKTQSINSYLSTMQEWSREAGAMSGKYDFAEGWRKHYHPGLCSADANPLLTALRELAFSRCHQRPR